MAILIAYYSRADENYFQGAYRYITVGNTQKSAQMIKELTGGELFKIEQKIPYAKDYNTCIAQAKRDKQSSARPELAFVPESLDEYDEIYLGYPNYWGTMPMAVYTFLEKFDFSDKIIHPFCTNEGSGLSNTVSDIKRVCPSATVTAGLSINGSSVDSAKPLIENWINNK